LNKSVLRDVANKHPTLILAPYDVIMEQHGIDAVFSFSEYLGGRNVYIPSSKTIFQKCLEQEAAKNFDGKEGYIGDKIPLHLRVLFGRRRV
jgi:Mor family transcriptional regulator